MVKSRGEKNNPTFVCDVLVDQADKSDFEEAHAFPSTVWADSVATNEHENVFETMFDASAKMTHTALRKKSNQSPFYQGHEELAVVVYHEILAHIS